MAESLNNRIDKILELEPFKVIHEYEDGSKLGKHIPELEEAQDIIKTQAEIIKVLQDGFDEMEVGLTFSPIAHTTEGAVLKKIIQQVLEQAKRLSAYDESTARQEG